MHYILGSASPRRKEILDYFSLPCIQIAPHTIDEEKILFAGDPVQYVKDLALAKGKHLAATYKDTLIITADTTVYIDGTILNKPLTEKDVYTMLSTLSGRWHSVFTAIALTLGNHTVVDAEETKVLSNDLLPEDIQRSCRMHHPFDKAGGYTIQKSGSMIVKKIEGCYYNVLGFPINTFRNLLKTFGVDLWDYLKEV